MPARNRRCKKVNVNPADAPAVQPAGTNKRDDLVVTRNWGIRKNCVRLEHLRPASAVSDEEFTVDEFVAHYLRILQQLVHHFAIWLSIIESAKPHTCIGENHATRFRRERAGASRRLGTSLE
jgi:hypothetical protein